MQVPRVLSRSVAVTAVVAAAAFAAPSRPSVHARQPAAVPGGVPAIGAAQPAATAAQPGPRLAEHADPVVDYRISVRLDREKHQLLGRERLVWRNPSTDTVGELRFHLYLNAFKNSKSTFYRESGGRLRGDDMPVDGWGWIDITSMKLADGADLTRAMRFEAPDDGNTADQTVVAVVLPAPVPPGGSATLDIEFLAQLPRVFARTGFKDDFHMVGQWFPKIGVYEQAGMRGRTSGGWNCHQFHANSEFYADYGHYEVDITVPSSFVLGATGARTARRDNGDGTTTYTHAQGDVHDFAWTADPGYVEMRRVFSATQDVTPEEYRRVAALLDRTEDEVRLTDVEIILLVQKPHLPQAERYFDSATLAIKWFGLWYGRYPFKTLTVVDPAPGAGGAGGMEYPTLITGGTSFLLNRGPLARVRAPEAVTVHEFGHNFWYGLVGNNEFEEAWLDEGFNSYSTANVMKVGYGDEAGMGDVFGVKFGITAMARMTNGPGYRFDRVRQPAWTYLAGAYGFYSYQKPELLLATLERHLGEQTMARVMRTYHERWRFRHPSSDDFYAVANEVSGQDLGWFFRQAVEGDQVLDFDVSRATSTRVLTDAGHLDLPAGRELVSLDTARERDRSAKEQPGQYETTVVVRRRGEFVFPVEIAFKFEGKPAERARWDARDRWKKFTFTRPEKLKWVEIDPDRKVLLDVNWLNNSRRAEADTTVVSATSARWLFVLQQVLGVMAW